MRKMILATLLILAGCASAPPLPQPVAKAETPIFHPTLPKPLKVCYVHWKVLVVDGVPYVALSYEDNINFAMCGKDLEAYISELNEAICQYRHCNKEQDDLSR